MTERTYTTFQVARICRVFPTTVINWVNRGKLKAYTTPGGHRRIMASDLAAFAAKYQMPIEEPRKLRIMIIEDDRDVGLLLQRTIKRWDAGVEIEWLENGVEALLALARTPPEAVILDVVMPMVDGARVLATLRADPQTKHIKVIGITGKRLSPDKLRFMKLHSDAFFKKPFDLRELLLALERVLRIPVLASRR